MKIHAFFLNKLLVALFCILCLSRTVKGQDTIKAKILDDGANQAQVFYNKGIDEFKVRNLQNAFEASAICPEWQVLICQLDEGLCL